MKGAGNISPGFSTHHAIFSLLFVIGAYSTNWFLSSQPMTASQ
jgi:hypothetical protein